MQWMSDKRLYSYKIQRVNDIAFLYNAPSIYMLFLPFQFHSIAYCVFIGLAPYYKHFYVFGWKIGVQSVSVWVCV